MPGNVGFSEILLLLVVLLIVSVPITHPRFGAASS
jgi:hypothetical protein